MKILQACFSRAPDASDLSDLATIDPQLVLVFGSVALISDPCVLQSLRSAFPDAELAGCSTAGEIADDGVLDDQLVLTALHFRDPGFVVATTDLHGMSDSSGAGLRLAQQLNAPDLHNVIVFSQGVNVNGSALLEGFSRGLAPGVKLSGGLAGDGAAFKKTYTLSRHAVSSEQMVAIGFTSPHLELRHGSLHGWNPFGPARAVTRCEGNVLYELDGAPALEVYKKYLGAYAKDLPGSGLLFPFEMLSSDHQTMGLIRTILGIDEAVGSLTLAGDIAEGCYLRLMHATTDSLVDGAHEAAISAGVDGQSSAQHLALLVSCVGRKLVMGARVDEEVEAVTAVLGGNVRVAGFYSYGEISPGSHDSVVSDLHNQTMTITHLIER
ncbi:MAG: hypothetical protein B7Y51_08860 [Burkholderiales bacterium 28-67-8]|nr:MAG: hypothetical protein B7Y51_08860 [Burkholderiales bacterium 28-67-8]